jgi:thioredoxin 1
VPDRPRGVAQRFDKTPEVFPLNDDVKVLTSQGWDAEVLAAKDVILVDFWAEWCPPCRKLGPAVERLASEYAGRVRVGKLNVDDHPEVANRYGIRSIPSLLLFQGGRVIEQRVGALPIDDLRALVAPHAAQLAETP